MWMIDKTFEFCYGHRVHTQTLNSAYADDLKCACRHLHGHEGKVQVFLEGDVLDPTGMVTDFRHLEWLKRWINEYLDHQFIIDLNDPLIDKLIDPSLELIEVHVPGTNGEYVAGWKVDLSKLTTDYSPAEIEQLEGMFIVAFVPTSEKLSQWLGHIVQAKMKHLHVSVSRVDWWETPKSRSTFIAPVRDDFQFPKASQKHFDNRY